MQTETTFRLGGAISIALGGVLAVGLLWAGAGIAFFGAWLAVPLSVVLGAFFWHVAGEVRRFRTEYLRAVETGTAPPPGGPPR